MLFSLPEVKEQKDECLTQTCGFPQPSASLPQHSVFLKVCTTQPHCKLHTQVNTKQTTKNPNRTLTQSCQEASVHRSLGLTSKLQGTSPVLPQLRRVNMLAQGPEGSRSVHQQWQPSWPTVWLALPQKASISSHSSCPLCSSSLLECFLSPLGAHCPCSIAHRILRCPV